jgi:D-alanyl-D-alanine carboxypeptidase
MKRIFFIVMVSMLFLSLYEPVLAVESPTTISTDIQIASLLDQIARLKTLIAKILLQKSVSSESYAVIDLSNGSVITQKNDSQAYPIASVTKLMNAVVSVENIDLTKSITLDSQMLKPDGYSPSLYVNLRVSAKDLLKAALIQSTNDAAQALSYFIGNEKFISLMNKKAAELGMNNTQYYDVHGLNPKNHSSSADLAKLLGYIYKNHPEILAITKENDFWLPDPTGKLLKFENVNNMYQDPDFLGAKSGYIPEAKQTLAGVAIINGKPIAIALLHSNNRKADALNIVDWLKTNSSIVNF